jgi:hypothetical protein
LNPIMGLLIALYAILAAYLPISRILPAGHSLRIALDERLPLVAWLGPVYVIGMVPIAALPLLFQQWLPEPYFRQYAAVTMAGALISYAAYFLYPSEIQRPPLPEAPAARWCLGVAYAARSPRGIFPSGHAFYTATNAWFLCELLPASARADVVAASLLVVAAALLTRLHFVLDIAGGLALALLLIPAAAWGLHG